MEKSFKFICTDYPNELTVTISVEAYDFEGDYEYELLDIIDEPLDREIEIDTLSKLDQLDLTKRIEDVASYSCDEAAQEYMEYLADRAMDSYKDRD